MKHLFFLILLAFSGSALSQKTFHIYDGFTLKLIDSVEVSSENKKTEIRTPQAGICVVKNASNGTRITFKKPGYQSQFFDCSDHKTETFNIVLEPSESLLKTHKSKYPYYRKLTSVTNETNSEAPETDGENPTEESAEKDSILTIVDQMAEFPGGQPELMKYLMKNLRYPLQAVDLEISGKVYVMFIVTSTGKITNLEIKKSVNLPMDAESYRVVKEMPDWTPGYVNGKAVNSYFSLPINFKLQ